MALLVSRHHLPATASLWFARSPLFWIRGVLVSKILRKWGQWMACTSFCLWVLPASIVFAEAVFVLAESLHLSYF